MSDAATATTAAAADSPAVRPLPAFAGAGIELEYMIVDARTLDVRPLALPLLARLGGAPASSVDRDPYGWSNELVAHVVELKNSAPSPALPALAAGFQREVDAALQALAPLCATLMPTGMHPWMDPARETTLWSFDNAGLYAAFDRLFDCRRHGWANLQSMHVNLPFADDREFARLHAAVRLVLPLVPVLAASSPFADGRASGLADTRLAVYRTNSAAVPPITGDTIPEPVDNRDAYEREILAPIYRAIAPRDPDGVLQHEWLNARGAIARFDRHAIEIRLADTQECPAADLAIAAVLVALVRALYEERWSPHAAQRSIATAPLAALLEQTLARAEDAPIDDRAFLDAFGVARARCTAGELVAELVDRCASDPCVRVLSRPLDVWKRHGTLARRILRAAGPAPGRTRLQEVYAALCACLAEGRAFLPTG